MAPEGSKRTNKTERSTKREREQKLGERIPCATNYDVTGAPLYFAIYTDSDTAELERIH
jgi:hypothetical protein